MVDVWRPLVERRGTDLEEQADREQRDPRDDQTVVAGVGGQCVRDPAQRDRAREAVEQRGAVEEEGGGEGPEDEVLERSLLREQATATCEPGHDVERQREHLERDEHHEQVRRRGEEQHAADAEQEQRPHLGLEPAESRECLLVLGSRERRCAGGEVVTGRVDRALSHDEGSDRGEDEDRALHEQRRAVDRDRAHGHDLRRTAKRHHGDERCDESGEREDELQHAAVGLRHQRLDQHRHHRGAEDDQDRQERAVLDRRGVERADRQ